MALEQDCTWAISTHIPILNGFSSTAHTELDTWLASLLQWTTSDKLNTVGICKMQIKKCKNLNPLKKAIFLKTASQMRSTTALRTNYLGTQTNHSHCLKHIWNIFMLKTEKIIKEGLIHKKFDGIQHKLANINLPEEDGHTSGIDNSHSNPSERKQIVPAGPRNTAMATRNSICEQQKLKLVSCYTANPWESHTKSNLIKSFRALWGHQDVFCYGLTTKQHVRGINRELD